MRLPEGVFFAKSHTWLSLFPSGKVRLGVDDFVAGVLENPQIKLVKNAGEQVEKGDPIIVLEQGDRHLTVRSPLAGRIVAANSELQEQPERLRTALFSDGWAYTLQPAKAEELRELMLGAVSRNWMMAELRRLRDLLAGAVPSGTLAPVSLQDGGTPAPGVLKHLGTDEWKRFEDQFLQVQ
jgi:glycine cleavage system H protein